LRLSGDLRGGRKVCGIGMGLCGWWIGGGELRFGRGSRCSDVSLNKRSETGAGVGVVSGTS